MLGSLADTARGRQTLEWLGYSADRTASKVGLPVSHAGTKLLSAFPATGVLFSAGGAALDMAAGESPQQAVASNAAGYVADSATTGLLLVAASGGPATFGAEAVGVGVSMLANWAVDELMEQ